MMLEFILMTIAFVIMLIVALVEKRTINNLSNKLYEIERDGWRKAYGFDKVYRRRYVFVNIENIGDNSILNRFAENYYNNGYDLDREKSTDRLLVFVKSEEVGSREDRNMD